MKTAHIFFAFALALAMLAGSFTSAAAGPVDDQPTQGLDVQSFVHQTLHAATDTSRQHRNQNGPAPCLNEGSQISHVPTNIILPGSLK